jgi:hypothetical protein
MKRQFIGLLWVLAGTVWAGTEGTSSTYYGNNAGAAQGAANSGLYNNTFIGADAGSNNISGSSNTFVGRSSGFSNTAGTQNTFIGDRAGYSTTAASGATFVGSFAGQFNTADNNTFVGSFAGRANGNGTYNTFLGYQAGYANATGNLNTLLGYHAGLNSAASNNTFVGGIAGQASTVGNNNTYLGYNASALNTVGQNNTSLGAHAGAGNVTGSSNVFVGYRAGYNEAGSNKLYIDNCFNVVLCVNPFIYGEFDNHLLKLNGMTEVHYNGQPMSQLNFSLTSTDTGGYLTSVLDNNFFASSGARYDGTLAPPNQWVQRSADGNSVIAGSGGAGYRIFTSSGNSVDAAFTPTVRLHINYTGEFGINQAPVAGHEIHTSSGAYLASGTWTNASSRELKDNILDLQADAAAQTLASLKPVTFNYKTDTAWQHVGFVAEDVPELVASPDRKGLSPMDIVAVLTKVVQEQRDHMAQQDQKLEAERSDRESMKEQLRQLAAEVARLQALR